MHVRDFALRNAFIFWILLWWNKIKDAIHIRRERPSLNSQVKHVNLKRYLYSEPESCD